MSTWAARYVKLGKERDADIARLRAQLGDGAAHLQVDPSASFAMITVAAPSLAPDDLAALSRDFGEALSIQGQTVADLVIYDRFVDGARTRGFTHAGEAGWIRVIGEPEAWEAAHFFATARLQELVDELEEELDDAATLEREKADVQRLWSAAKLQEGSTRPHVELTSLTRVLTKHFGLPMPQHRPSTMKQKIAG